jgi:hypothetical protein
MAMYVDFQLLPQLFIGRKQPSASTIAKNLAINCALGAVGAFLFEGLGAMYSAMQGLGPVAEDALALDAAETWGNQNKLAGHFADHGADFGNSTAEGYANQASDFLQESQANNYPTKIDSNGTIRTYDPSTNTFGAYNSDGTTRTFFSPDPAVHGYPSNWDYWGSQPGVPPWHP